MSFSIQPWRIQDWFNFIPDSQNKQFQVYATHLVKANQTMNLISPKSLPMLDLVHFADSILASQLVYKSTPGIKSLHDIGSGSGFPGLVFGIMYPEVSVTLVESDAKKAEFLKGAVSLLGQKNVQVLHQTVETIKDDTIQVAMSRDFAQLTKALITTRKCFVKGGIYYHQKGDEWSMEVSHIPTQLCSQWDVALLGDYKLPSTEFKISIVRTSRIK